MRLDKTNKTVSIYFRKTLDGALSRQCEVRRVYRRPGSFCEYVWHRRRWYYLHSIGDKTFIVLDQPEGDLYRQINAIIRDAAKRLNEKQFAMLAQKLTEILDKAIERQREP